MSKITDYINSTRYQYEVEARLQPDPLIVHGNYKRYSPLKDPLVLNVPEVRISEDEDNRRQDAYLAKHGIK